MTESDVATACDALAVQLGWSVERYEQRRASRIHEGLPDRRYVHRAREYVLWVELKAPKGQLTREQHDWLKAEQAAGGLAVAIDSRDVLLTLFQLLARRSSMDRAVAYRRCVDLTDLLALRGYRGERKPKKNAA